MYVYQNGNSSIFKVVELIKLRISSFTYVKFTTESNSMHNRCLLTTFLSENVLKHWLFIPEIGKISAQLTPHFIVFKETHNIRSPAFMRLLSNTLSVIRHLNCHQISILEDTNQTTVRVRANLRGWILRPIYVPLLVFPQCITFY